MLLLNKVQRLLNLLKFPMLLLNKLKLPMLFFALQPLMLLLQIQLMLLLIKVLIALGCKLLSRFWLPVSEIALQLFKIVSIKLLLLTASVYKVSTAAATMDRVTTVAKLTARQQRMSLVRF